ncbi:hypothetical protein thsps21_18250 [Pseudomonas sp. No.21]|uniref:hypothetical protein n=1 Tax=Pseudomonas sp. TUM22785 TaxID=3019098 RepID=UPI00230563ED|nr:hypothetical protein [Pseudomonas sp. TUM22785]WCD78560.1 hypothetical protein PI990_21475 [Pseudomonas sp. TUM22785]
MTKFANIQTLIEFAEHDAITNNNRRFSSLSYFYLQFQSQIRTIVAETASFKTLPVAFSSQTQLLGWAANNHFDVQNVGAGISRDEALRLVGSNSSPQIYYGQVFIWVRASSNNYRLAFLAELDRTRIDKTAKTAQRNHGYAAEYCDGIIKALKEKIIRKYVSDARRSQLISGFESLKNDFLKASQCPTLAVNDRLKLDLLDRVVDADHVVNRKSLTELPDAWVMLAPVNSTTNRKFGWMIERYINKADKSTISIQLDPIMAFKLHAATLPQCPFELQAALDTHRKLYIPNDGSPIRQEFADAELVITEVVAGKRKAITR